uniref:Secreted protein n=1 Tax=Arundo donax TaxID=35708 RepID=A0A0A8Z773_ARUDO
MAASSMLRVLGWIMRLVSRHVMISVIWTRRRNFLSTWAIAWARSGWRLTGRWVTAWSGRRIITAWSCQSLGGHVGRRTTGTWSGRRTAAAGKRHFLQEEHRVGVGER